MTDVNLPYFYNLPPAVLLGIYSASRLQDIANPHPGSHSALALIVMLIPSLTAGFYFLQQFREQRELSLRQGLFILVAVQLLTSLLPSFLR